MVTIYGPQKTKFMQTELQSLQNAANIVGLVIYEKFQEDKRRTVKKYFAQKGIETVSPVLDYEQLNYFLFGWIACNKEQS